MGRCFHLALAVDDVEAATADYTNRLGVQPVVHVEGAYALWRTPEVNLSISMTKDGRPGMLHVGLVDPGVSAKTYSTDCTGLLWESFSVEQQDAEIAKIFG
jgi:catechol 2,3-dioxygenase-like lactoylglutathione lyase family enzyme